MLFPSVIVVLTLLMTAPGIHALERVNVDTFQLGKEERIDAETWVRAREVVIEGEIGADLFILATEARLSGGFQRSLWALSDQVTLDGLASDTARLAGRVIVVEGQLAGDLRAVGETVKVGAEARVDGDVWLMGDTVICEGEFMGPVHITARTVVLAGQFHDRVHADGGDISFLPGSEFHGDVTYRAPNELFPGGKTTFHGTLERLAPLNPAARDGFPARLATSSIFFLAALMAGLPFLSLFPSYAAHAVQALHQSRIRCMLTGLTGLILFPLTALFCLSTLIGIPLGLLLAALFAALLYLAQFIVALILGGILFKGRKATSLFQVMTGMAAGLLVFHALRYLPYIGWTLQTALTIFGFGALLRAMFVRTRIPSPSAAVPHAESAGS